MLQFSVSPKAELPPLRIEPFKGVNLAVTATQIDQSQSPDMLNMHIDERGALNKRTGYQRLYDSLGDGPINGLFMFRKADGTEKFLISHGGKLFREGTITIETPFWKDENLNESWGV
jgi:hypothetical protein